MPNKVVNHLELYRLPWTLPDNAISWLEPTSMCNLACDGCYRENQKNSHKTLDQVKHELDVFQSKSNSDCISITGGDPLLHPQILDIIAEIKKRGLKPIVPSQKSICVKNYLEKQILREFIHSSSCKYH
jgi:organic radical activating enzyme